MASESALSRYAGLLGSPAFHGTPDGRDALVELAGLPEPVLTVGHDGLGDFWSVFSARSAERILARGAPSSSRHGMMLGFSREHPDPGQDDMMVCADGPGHRRRRRLFAPLLQPSRVPPSVRRRLVETAQLVCDRLNRPGEQVDLVQEGRSLASIALLSLIEIPGGDWRLVEDLAAAAFLNSQRWGERASFEHAELLFYLRDHVRACLARGLGPAEFDAGVAALGLDSFLLNLTNVLLAGLETTRHAITELVWNSVSGPAGADADGVLIGRVLRDRAPARHVMRVCVGDYGSEPLSSIHESDRVVLWLPSITASSSRESMAFGFGPHRCLGQALAMWEMSVVATALGGPARPARPVDPVCQEYLGSTLVTGWATLHVEVGDLSAVR